MSNTTRSRSAQTALGARLAVALVLCTLDASLLWAADKTYPQLPDAHDSIYFSSGFIRESVPVHATVTQPGSKRTLYGIDDTLFLDMRGNARPVPGDLYTVYRNRHQVYHPTQRRYLGDLIMILGVIEVTKIVDDRLAAVRVIRAYASIYPGDAAMRFTPIPKVEPKLPGQPVPDRVGMIVDVENQRTLIGQGHVVYVDWGRRDGLQVGDRLEVYHPLLGLPPQLIGEIRVLALEEETATAMVAKSTTVINRGDRVVFKERGEPPPVVREPREAPKPIEEARLTPPEEIPPKRPIDIQEVKDELQEELDRLVNLLHYESGQFTVKPESLPVLNQIGELLKSVEDRHIRIEGHTDNVEIGPKLKPLFPSNQELSEARATHVLRYLTQVGGLSPENLSAIGFADTKPLAENTEEAGRSKNRRVHIKLIPKDATPSEGPEALGAPTTAPEAEPAPPDASMTPGQLSPMGNPQSSPAPGSPDQPASEQPAMDGGTGAEEPMVPQTTTSTVP